MLDKVMLAIFVRNLFSTQIQKRNTSWSILASTPTDTKLYLECSGHTILF